MREFEEDKIKAALQAVNTNSTYVENIVNDLVKKYTSELDEVLDNIKIILQDADNPPTNAELDSMALRIPVVLYFMTDAQELVGIYEDVSKAIKDDAYYNVHMQATGTMAEKQTQAQLAVMYETILNNTYSRVYKIIQQKTKAGYELLASIKRVMYNRSNDANLSNNSFANRITPTYSRGEIDE